MVDRVDLQTVNSFVLRKQHLTDDSRGSNVLQVVRDVNGLHATAPATPYLSLLARIGGFEKHQLDDELHNRKRLGKIRCVRGTVYVLPREVIPIAIAATRRMIEPQSERFSQHMGITPEEYERTSRKIMALLDARDGMSASEIRKALRAPSSLSPILHLMCDRGLLARGKPRGGWRSNTHTYSTFQSYFPDMDLDEMDESEARALLVQSYIASFGPVTKRDIAWWTGLRLGEVGQILESLRDRLVEIEVTDLGDNLILSREDELLLLSTKTPKGLTVNFLPTLDSYLMGYKERQRYLEHRHYEMVFDRSGNATSVILVDGRVVGVWDYLAKPEPSVVYYLLEKVGKKVRDAILASARRVGEFIAETEVAVRECERMTPLTEQSAGSMMSPLKGC